MRCHACGREVPIPPGERVGFRETCDGCQADLHVCRNCAHHDPAAYNECREPGAERVGDRDRANRCDWFAPGEGAAEGEGTSTVDAAKAQLDALFKKP